MILDGDPLLNQAVILEELAALPDHNCQQRSLARVDGIREDANRSEMIVSASAPGWLVIPTVSYPGWQAQLDGQPAALLRANYLFQAVYVPAGSHTVVLVYRPYSFYAGLFLSAASGLLVSLWLVSLRRRAASYKPKS